MSRSSRKFDVIVVLGGPDTALRRRIAHGVRLFDEGRADRILLTGRGRRAAVEAEVMRDRALAAGVPNDRIVLEAESLSTLENAAFSARIMRARGWRSALVVTDFLHVPRALLAFRSVGVRAKASAAAGGWREEPVRAWGRYLAYEAVALIWYAALILAGRHRG
ncbi:MAG: YdcF family protein [Kiloniellaceae bacterium]